MTDPDPNPNPAPDPKPDPPADPPGDRSFSQSDVDRIVQDRIAREREKYKGFDDLKAKAEQFDQLQESQKTELEKAQARAELAEKTAADTEKRAREAQLRAAIVAEAAKAARKVTDPEAAVTFLTGPDADLLDVDDAGNPKDIAKTMDSLLERRAYLVAPQGGARGNADQGARGGGANQLTREDLQKMTSAEIVKAQADGRLDHLLGAKT